MKFGANRSRLYDAQKSARGRWDIACEDWHDLSRKDHDERVWTPLDEQVGEVLRGIDQLTVIFAQVRRECEFQPYS